MLDSHVDDILNNLRRAQTASEELAATVSSSDKRRAIVAASTSLARVDGMLSSLEDPSQQDWMIMMKELTNATSVLAQAANDPDLFE